MKLKFSESTPVTGKRKSSRDNHTKATDQFKAELCKLAYDLQVNTTNLDPVYRNNIDAVIGSIFFVESCETEEAIKPCIEVLQKATFTLSQQLDEPRETIPFSEKLDTIDILKKKVQAINTTVERYNDFVSGLTKQEPDTVVSKPIILKFQQTRKEAPKFL